MKNTIKNTAYAAAWLSLMALNTANAKIGFTWKGIDEWLKWSDKTADIVIQSWVAYISTFLSIIAIIVILWAGFQILTSAWDEEKTKKWKTIIIQAVIWLLVIFIASSIVNLIITWLFVA
jgi:type IV secretory pathway VirB2 component (pilin)